jgi:DNA-binding SARP family transcriptional activator/predicted ATPase
VKPQAPHIRAATITVQLLRPFSVAIDGVAMPARAWRLRHPRQLFQMLCLRSGQRLHRDAAIEALWPQSDAQASANRLYHTIHVLRAEFAKMGLDAGAPVVVFEAGTLSLNPHHQFSVDALRFDSIVQGCRTTMDDESCDAQLEQAVALWPSTPIAAPAQDAWLNDCHGEAREKFAWVLERLASRLRERGRGDEAVAVLQRLVALEPSNEVAHRALMELFDAAGRPERAMLQYTACKRFLQRDLGSEPSPPTQALRDRMAAQLQRPGAQRAAATARAAYLPPPPRGRLLGREAEMTELQARLEDPRSRMITIAAAAGTGKTSLAVALANAVHTRLRDGALVVRLTDLADAAGLEQRICQTMNLSVGNSGPETALREHLADKELLLVLDRFEHVVAAAPRMSRLIAASPGLQLVVTSQCALGCQAEQVFALRQLAQASPQAALELFAHTARAAGATAAQLADAAAIMRLCERLGGNALAIQLAAGHAASRSIDELGTELDPPANAVTPDALDSEPQHGSLRAAIGWSVSLLDHTARSVLQGLAVFHGAFVSDDALTVLGGILGVADTRRACLTLLERHLLSRDGVAEGSEASPSATSFILLDSIRQHLLESADAFPHWPAAQAAHARLFALRARQAAELVDTGRTPDAIAIYAVAAQNIERGLDWQWAHAALDECLRSSYDACLLQLTSGGLAEGIARLRYAVSRPTLCAEERHLSARCWYLLARALYWMDDMPGSVRAMLQARRGLVGSADTLMIENVGLSLARIRTSQLRLRAAAMHIDRVSRLDGRSEAPRSIASRLQKRLAILMLQGEFDQAHHVAQQAFDTALAAEDPDLIYSTQHSMLEASLRRGLFASAHAIADDCRAMQNLGFGVLAEFGLKAMLFSLHFESQEYDAALVVLEELRHLAQATRSTRAIGIELCAEFIKMETERSDQVHLMLFVDQAAFPFDSELGDFYLQLHCYRLRLLALRGPAREAQRTLDDLLLRVRRSRNRLWASWVVSALADVAAARDDTVAGRWLLEAASMLQRDAGIEPSPRQVSDWRRIHDVLAAGSVAFMAEGQEPGPPVAMTAVIDAAEAWGHGALGACASPTAAAAKAAERGRAAA